MNTMLCPSSIIEKILSLELTEDAWTWIDMGLDIVNKSCAKKDLWHTHRENIPDDAIVDAIYELANIKQDGKCILENSSMWFCVFRILVDVNKFTHNEYKEFKKFVEHKCPEINYRVSTNALAKNNVGIFSKNFEDWKWNDNDGMFRKYSKFKRYYSVTEHFKVLLFRKIGNNYS